MWLLKYANLTRTAVLYPDGLSIAFILFLILVWLLWHRALPKPIAGIPYNSVAATRFFGDLPEYRAAANYREWLAHQAVKHQSPIFQVFLKPFSKPYVFITDYYEAANITVRRMKEFDRSNQVIRNFEGVVPVQQITLHSSDPRYKRNRELVRDLMSPTFLHKVSAPHIYNVVVRLIKLWDGKLGLSQGRPFEAVQDTHYATLDMIVMAAFGLDEDQTQLVRQLRQLKVKSKSAFNATSAPDLEFEFEPVALDNELAGLTVLSDSATVAIRSPFPRLHHFLYRNLYPSMRHARAMTNQLQCREIAKGIQRQRNGEAQTCAIDHMLARESVIADKEDKEPNYYSQAIKSELLGYLAAGHETTSATIRWGLKYLTDDQKVQSTLREALKVAYPKAAAENSMPAISDIIKTRVPYLEATIEEIIRCSKVLPVSLRDALEDTQVLGIQIPKGTTIGFLGNSPGITSPSVPFDNKRLRRSDGAKTFMQKTGRFDDDNIQEFFPGRWLKVQLNAAGQEEIEFNQNAGPSLAFGQGPRGCFGKRLAYLEMRILFTLVIWNYRLLQLPEVLATHEEEVSVVRAPKHVYVKLQRI